MLARLKSLGRSVPSNSNVSETMGKSGRAPAKPAADAKREGKFVPKYEYFAKAKLASYPNEDGGCLHLEKGQDEKKSFDLDSIVKSRSGGNEELCHRMGMGIALDAAAAACGVAVLDKHFSGEWPEEVQKELRKSGLPKIKAALSTEKGKAFAAAVKVLNVGKEGQPREEDIKRAMKTFVTYVQDDPDQLRVSLARLAADTSCLYVWAMTLLKDMALLQHPKDWASKMEGKQTEVVKAWMRRPTDVEKLRKALVSELMTKVKSHKPSKGQKRKASESSNETHKAPSPGDSHPDASSGKSDASDTAESNLSSSEEKRKKASTKENGSSAGSAEESASEKSSKKEKKDKKKDKKKENKKKATDKNKEKAKKEQKRAKKELMQKEKAAKKKEEEKKKKEEEKKRREAEKAKPEVSEISLSSEEDPEVKETAEGPYADWPMPDRKEFGRHVQEAMESQTSAKKGDKLTLAALVSVMDNIPDNILQFHKLADVLAKLKGMQKLPPQAKTEQILQALQAIATAADALPAKPDEPVGSPWEEKEKEKEKKEKASEEASPPPAEGAAAEEAKASE